MIDPLEEAKQADLELREKLKAKTTEQIIEECGQPFGPPYSYTVARNQWIAEFEAMEEADTPQIVTAREGE